MTYPLLWSSSYDPNITLHVAADPLKTTDLYYDTSVVNKILIVITDKVVLPAVKVI
jgi:hypothetical protein